MNFEDRVGGQDDTAAALFAAARAYRAPAHARRRTVRALGLPVGLSLLAPGLAQAAAALASAKGWIVVVGAIASAAGAYSVTHVLREPAAAKRAPSVVSAHQTAISTTPCAGPNRPLAGLVPPAAPSRGRGPEAGQGIGKAASRRTRLAPSPPPTTKPATNIATGGEPAFAMSATATATAAAALAPRAEASSLRAELALVAAARARLRAGDARGTLAVLDDYPRRFPAGVLAEEVELLSMRALGAAGENARARREGADFLARHPGSPLAGAVRALVDSATPRAQEGDER